MKMPPPILMKMPHHPPMRAPWIWWFFFLSTMWIMSGEFFYAFGQKQPTFMVIFSSIFFKIATMLWWLFSKNETISFFRLFVRNTLFSCHFFLPFCHKKINLLSFPCLLKNSSKSDFCQKLKMLFQHISARRRQTACGSKLAKKQWKIRDNP